MRRPPLPHPFHMNWAAPVMAIIWLRQPPPLAFLLTDLSAAALRAISLPLSGGRIWIEPPPAGQTPSSRCIKRISPQSLGCFIGEFLENGAVVQAWFELRDQNQAKGGASTFRKDPAPFRLTDLAKSQVWDSVAIATTLPVNLLAT